MSFDSAMTSRLAKELSLLALRVTTGFLIIWFGLNRAVTGNVPAVLASGLDMQALPGALIGTGAGIAEALIGVLCVLGLWRRVALPLQALINGATAARVWWAIIDPFRWYIDGVDRIVFNSHVFYPASITFAACILLITFRDADRLALDRLRAGATVAQAGD